MSCSKRSWISAAVLLVALGGCTKPPAIPGIDLAKLPRSVRGNVEQAWANALARPDDVPTLAEFGYQLHAAMDYANAATVYRRARLLKKDSYALAYLDGRASLSAGDFAAAAEAFEAAAKLKPDAVRAKLGWAETYDAKGDMAKAGEIYRSIGEHPLAHFGLARSLTGRAALAEYEKAVALDPKFGAAHEAIALIAGQVGDTARAERAREDAKKYRGNGPMLQDPEMEPVFAVARAASDRLRQGLLAEKDGRWAEAARLLEQAVADDPSRAQAWVTLVGVHTRLKNREAAEKAYQKAMELKTDSADAHYNYGVLMIETNRRPEAAAAFEKAVKSDPKYELAYYNLGVLAEEAQQVPRAAAMLEKALELNPKSRGAKYHLGKIRNAQKRWDAAIQLFMDSAEPLDDMTPYVLYSMGASLNGKGEAANAYKVLERARGIAAERKMTQVVAEIDRDLKAMKQVR